ncbi:DUF2637 domain-containing protein [Methanospirillum stamsii]|uniref:HTH iclR-type domain-containing protein n=1 Tax=Methanospirillum stamsii TaxID=1277351 RepID=A0A2V2NAK3_9EURY|nr:DUF2637 domain-containing protein [Methanospirillum stamsii]PWR73357.1 hypothetical protein DLD82_10855 [Methanospirillum stamsii]
MIPVKKIEQSIPDLTALAVLTIAASAFLLSFANLQAAAQEAGISPFLSWLWPLCVDALLIAGSLMILRSNLRNESPIVGWSVLIVFTGISTLFNVIHSPDGIMSRLSHAVPPIALCISVELLMMCLRSDIAINDTPEEEQDPQCTESAPVQQDCNIPARNDTAQLVMQHFREHPESTVTAAAESLGLHRTTISRHLKTLSAAGVLS